MKLINGDAIRQSLDKISPVKIAVAYVGWDWFLYIDAKNLSEIILSPTFGSNPRAILQIAEKLGWEKVHFLDDLHSKIYIGKKSAAIGSFNLTKNGLSGNHLQEAGILIEDHQNIEYINLLFDQYRSSAILEYPNKNIKLKKLKELLLITNLAKSQKIVVEDDYPKRLIDFSPISHDDFYVSWIYGELEYNSEAIKNEILTKPGKKPEDLISDSISFLETDDINRNSWVLAWSANEDYSPDFNHAPRWICIDEVVNEGVADSYYSKLAVQRKDRTQFHYPFELGCQEIAALNKVLMSGDFPELIGSDNSKWSVNDTFPVFLEFIDAVKKELISNGSGHTIDTSKFVEKDIFGRNVLRRATSEVLAFSRKHFADHSNDTITKVSIWAVHLVFADAGIPLDYKLLNMKVGTADRRWLISRMKNRKDEVVELLLAFSNTAEFGKEFQYWAEKSRKNLIGLA